MIESFVLPFQQFCSWVSLGIAQARGGEITAPEREEKERASLKQYPKRVCLQNHDTAIPPHLDIGGGQTGPNGVSSGGKPVLRDLVE